MFPGAYNLTSHDVVQAAADEALYVVDSVGGVHGSLGLRRLAHDTALSREGDPRGCRELTHRVWQDLYLLRLRVESSNTTVGRAQIDADDRRVVVRETSHLS